MKVIQTLLLQKPENCVEGGELSLFDLEEKEETESCVKIYLELDLDQMETE